MSYYFDNSDDDDRNARNGIGLGTVVAVICSWISCHSVFWAIINGFFGWLYVIYWLIFIHTGA